MASFSAWLPAALLVAKAMAVDNGLAITPQMGWNNWNAFGCDVNEGLVLDTASSIKYLGLQDLGYHYVVVDDCWSDGRDENNMLKADGVKFPNGMADVADKLHAQGFGFGMYSSAGTFTCAGYSASLGVETDDANAFASWGVDYLKYDNCYNEGQTGSEEVSSARYNAMAEALVATERPILYAICNWGEDNPWSWGPSMGNSWRMSGDITDSFNGVDEGCPLPGAGGWGCSVVRILSKAAEIASLGGPGGWNDLDMLEVGNGGMSDTEYVTHFSMWSLLKSPLIMGSSITELPAADLSILANPAIIAVNQDPLGSPAVNVWTDGDSQLWSGVLQSTTGGADDVVVGLVNTGESAIDISAPLSDIFVNGTVPSGNWEVRDLWAGRLSEEQAQSIIDGGAAGSADLLYNATATPYETGLGNGNEMLLGAVVDTIGSDGSIQASVESHGCAIFRLRSAE
ncbi:hypothetical protein FQN54_002228 [Arachnomyces sp. PD_36]|nr:hypothetical protein FQN54_002228 [Arachnomyces sp. PD_36]